MLPNLHGTAHLHGDSLSGALAEGQAAIDGLQGRELDVRALVPPRGGEAPQGPGCLRGRSMVAVTRAWQGIRSAPVRAKPSLARLTREGHPSGAAKPLRRCAV
jgi:hypothetical protein